MSGIKIKSTAINFVAQVENVMKHVIGSSKGNEIYDRTTTEVEIGDGI